MLSLSLFLFITFSVLFLGGVIFVHDPKSRTHQYFLLWIVLIVCWMVSSYLENVPELSHEARTLFIHLDFFFGPLAQAPLVLFVLNFINSKAKPWKRVLAVAPPILSSLLTLTPLHVAEVYFAETGEIRFTEGPAFLVFVIVTTLYFVVPCIVLFRHRKHATPRVKGQVTAIGIGLALTTVVLLGINLFLQNVLTVEQFRFGIYSMLFFVLGVGYAIIRHEFLKVRFVVVEVLLMAILSVILGRVILAESATEFWVNLLSFVALLVLGLALTRTFLREVEQRLQLQDLSEKLATANDSLKVANKKLKELDALKTEFLSIASHQLRTPLAVAKGYLSMLSSGMMGKVAKKQKETVALLDNNNENLIVLVNQILNLSRIESNRLKLNMAKVDFAKSVNDTVAFFSVRAKEKGLELKASGTSAPVMIEADPEKLREILNNLVDNAIKYTEKGGISIRMHATDGNAVVEIKDTGYGLTPRDKQHLFQKFASGSASKNANVTSGFGLFVVKKLVEAMHGSVSAESAGAGKGSTFTIAFPLAKNGR